MQNLFLNNFHLLGATFSLLIFCFGDRHFATSFMYFIVRNNCILNLYLEYRVIQSSMWVFLWLKKVFQLHILSTMLTGNFEVHNII